MNSYTLKYRVKATERTWHPAETIQIVALTQDDARQAFRRLYEANFGETPCHIVSLKPDRVSEIA